MDKQLYAIQKSRLKYKMNKLKTMIKSNKEKASLSRILIYFVIIKNKIMILIHLFKKEI